ncbi:MAG: RIP metalloprotease RseP [Ruminococcus sp.]
MRFVIAVIIFSILILFHELGHFLLAKKNGIIVDEFSLGMGPRLFSFVKGGTRYSLKLLPLGGSCMMRGEDEEDAGEGSFNSASVWGRISVVAAGPVFNFILAFFCALIVIGVIGYDPAEVIGFQENSPAAEAGLKEGDVITEINGTNVDIGRDIYNYETFHGIQNEPITVKYRRDGEEHTLIYEPYHETRYMLGFNYVADDQPASITSVSLDMPFHRAGILAGDVITAIDGTSIASGEELAAYFEEHPLGEKSISLTYERDGKEETAEVTPVEHTYVELGFYYNTARVKTGPVGVIKYGFVEIKYWVKTTVQSLGMLFTGKVSVNDMSGPVGVVTIIGDTYESSRSEGSLITWMSMLNMIILLSANLGIMNLLPIPALDGGRLVFLVIEAIRGKAINRDAEGMVHFVGLMLLLVLIVYVTIHDITRLF